VHFFGKKNLFLFEGTGAPMSDAAGRILVAEMLTDSFISAHFGVSVGLALQVVRGARSAELI
jgi:hypothetical protein